MSKRVQGGFVGTRPSWTPAVRSGIWTPEQSYAFGAYYDPYWANVTLLLHMDGASGSTTFTDSSKYGFVPTPFGDAQISTTQYKFNASALFDGTGDYLTVADNSAWDMPGDFTIEAWLYPTSFSYVGGSSNRAPIGFHTTTLSATAPAVLFVDTGTILFYGSSTVLTSTTALSVNTWAHVAFVRSGSTLTLYIDGASSGSATYTSSIQPNIVNIARSTSAAGDYSGYIDELRITNGVARYTSSFTPASAPFPDA